MFTDVLVEAQERGSMVGFAIASCFRSRVAHRLGRLREADADGTAAVQAAAEAGALVIEEYARAYLAVPLVDRGELERAAELLTGVPNDLESYPPHSAHSLLFARGALAAARGDNESARRDLCACGR